VIAEISGDFGSAAILLAFCVGMALIIAAGNLSKRKK